MNCPSCKSALSPTLYEGVEVHTCESCGGEFVGPDQLAYIIRVRDQNFDATLKSAAKARKPSFIAPEQSRGHSCPACSSPTQAVNYGSDTGVSVDRCTSCGGLWLDRDELELVQSLLEQWADEAPARVREAADDLERARKLAAAQVSNRFHGSRFAFVNALINRLLDAA